MMPRIGGAIRFASRRKTGLPVKSTYRSSQISV